MLAPNIPRLLLVVAAVFLALGGGLIAYSASIPVYTDPDAPDRISNQLAEISPDSLRFKEWFSRLSAFETPHKKLSDLGRGLFAEGVGALLALYFGSLYVQVRNVRTLTAIFVFWLLIWIARLPLSVWYYWIRESRFDYPVWGDSIAIPIISEWSVWLMGAVVSSALLALLLIRHPLPPKIHILVPFSFHGWIRFIILSSWLILLAIGVVEGIPNGDEGMVLSCTLASVVLLIFLSAPEIGKNLARQVKI
jgi:hypothetical protein